MSRHQLEQQKKIESFKGVVPPPVMNGAMREVIKGSEMTMQNALLSQQETHKLQSENQYGKRRKERTKHFIQNGGSLTVAEVRQQDNCQVIIAFGTTGLVARYPDTLRVAKIPHGGDPDARDRSSIESKIY